MSPDGKVLVIGSGFGGAIAAARIAEAGFAVTLVERGPWRDSVPVRSMGIRERAPFPIGRHLFTHVLRSIRTHRGRITLNKRGFLEFYVGRGLRIISASNVGGGSHAYGGLSMRPPEPGYWDAAGLSDAAMEPHYRNVAARIGTTAPKPGHMRNSASKLFGDSTVLSSDDDACTLTMGMLFPADPDRPGMAEHDGISRSEARPGQDGTFGSPGGGKTSLDFAYLHRAIRDHGLEVLDLSEARLIRPMGGGGAGRYRVTVCDLRTGRVLDHDADHVFVAAGTVNTLGLLLRSRAAPGGLKGMHRLGQRFFANGDLAFSCKLPPGRSTRLSIPVDGAVRCRDGAQPPGDRPWPLMILNTLPLVDMPLPAFAKRRMMRSIVIAGMGRDRGGTVSLEGNKLVIDYDPSRSPIYADIEAAAKTIATELGGSLSGGGTPTTAHPMGGACMGRSEADAVVDLNGEVFGNPGLYVCDAAALPEATGGPPSLSIGAWAEHVATSFVSRHGTAS